MKLIYALVLLVSVTLTAHANPVEVGKPAPSFTAVNLDGKMVSLAQFQGKIVVLEWINEGCPFSKGHYNSGNMQALQKEYTSKGIVWLTINSTRTDHPEYHTPAQAKAQLAEWKSSATDNLCDTSGTIGHLYGAKTTPHMFVIDAEGAIRYMGAIDDHKGVDGGKMATVNYVRAACDALLAGKDVAITTTNSYGCSVKY
jgi:peroxiredoxin